MNINNYSKSFKNRCQKYLYAINTYPHVMENEFKTAVGMLQLNKNKHEIILNIPGAGIDLDKYVNLPNKTILTFETSYDFVKLDPERYKLCSLTNIPLENNSVDRIIILTSLHHVELKERETVYKELGRVLKKDGLLVIGDVIKDSSQARLLNEFVDKWNSNGHKGIFFNEEDSNLLEKCGFKVDVTAKNYNWNFKNKLEMSDFVLNLFGLDLYNQREDKVNNLIKEISNYITLNKYGFEWKLIYFTCKLN